MSGDDLYRTMLTIRRFEERVVDLVNANEIAGVTHEYVSQEAVATGLCAALRADDVTLAQPRPCPRPVLTYALRTQRRRVQAGREAVWCDLPPTCLGH